MPNCSETKHKCGVACTTASGEAYYKDCKTGRIGAGKSYTEAKRSALGTRPKSANPITDKQKITQPIKNIRKSVPAGSRFDTKTNNWKDTEKLMGDPKPDDDPSTIGEFSGKCFDVIPIPCDMLAVAVGGLIVLVLAIGALK